MLGDTLMVNRSNVSLANSLRIYSSKSGTKRVLGDGRIQPALFRFGEIGT